MQIRDEKGRGLNLKTRVFKNSADRFEASGQLRLQDLDVRFLNGFLTHVIELKGEINGDIALSGLLKNPIYKGSTYARALTVYVPYTNVKHKFSPGISIGVSPGKLRIPPTAFHDLKFKRGGEIQGELKHERFSKWDINTHIKTDRLLVLHTDKAQHPGYFGTAFATGRVDVRGPTQNLNVEVHATTDKNTNLNIPLGGLHRVEKDRFITFMPPEKTHRAPDFFAGEPPQKERHEKRGNLNFHMNLKATADARARITFGGENPNYLISRGSGNLEVKANSHGDFNLYGTYRVSEGNYIFNFSDVISKRFTLESGSAISWNGNPHKATLNLRTRYDTKASNLGIYLADKSLKGNIDIALLSQISGDLSNPHFDFEVTTPRAGQTIQTALQARMQSTDEEIKQFGSILAMQRFSTAEPSSLGSGLSGSAVETVLNQLGRIFSNISDKVGVNLKYAQGNPTSNTADEFDVGLTAQLGDRITVDSNLGIPMAQSKTSRFSGEVAVSYDLNMKKTLQLKAFNRRDEMEGLSTQIRGYRQGLGIQYARDFNTFAELKAWILGRKKTKLHATMPKTQAELKRTGGG